MNIIMDMKKVNSVKGYKKPVVQKPIPEEGEEEAEVEEEEQEEPEDDNVDCLGLPLVDPWDVSQQKKEREPPRLIQQPWHSSLTIHYTPWYPKGAPTPSEEHRHLLVIGDCPKLFASILKARPSLAKEAMKRVEKSRARPRGVATPMRLVTEDSLFKAVQDSACTGVLMNYVDHDRVNHYDVVDLALRMIRSTQAMADISDPVSLEFLTSGQTHAAPDSLPQLRHPLHGTLMGICRSANQEYGSAGAEIRMFDIEPAHKRVPVPQIFYRGQQRPYAEGIYRRGIVYIPKVVGSGATPHHPMQYELIQDDFKHKAWEEKEPLTRAPY
jgi:hypothetical protein